MTNDTQKSNNPFQMLGIEPSFSITADQVQRAYLARLSSAHPDLVSGDDAVTSDPASLNTARDDLLNDESRANLMLELLQGPPSSDTSLPDGFLMDMMQLRTQVEEDLETEGDAARGRWQSWANARRAETIEHIGELFAQLDDASSDESRATAIKQNIRTQLNAWRYTERLIEQLDPTYDPNASDF